MGGTTLHAGILSQWFEMLLQLHLKRYAMVVNGILFGVMQPTVGGKKVQVFSENFFFSYQFTVHYVSVPFLPVPFFTGSATYSLF